MKAKHSPQRTTPTRRQPRLSEARILQISNDITEDMLRASMPDLVEVVRYWRAHYDALARRATDSLITAALGLVQSANALHHPPPATPRRKTKQPSV